MYRNITSRAKILTGCAHPVRNRRLLPIFRYFCVLRNKYSGGKRDKVSRIRRNIARPKASTKPMPYKSGKCLKLGSSHQFRTYAIARIHLSHHLRRFEYPPKQLSTYVRPRYTSFRSFPRASSGGIQNFILSAGGGADSSKPGDL